MDIGKQMINLMYPKNWNGIIKHIHLVDESSPSTYA
jgi:hypothetical protein